MFLGALARISVAFPGGGIGFDLSLSFQIKFTHSNDDWVKLSKFMCHDTRTADKFYVANLTPPQQAMEHRRLFDAALEGAERGFPVEGADLGEAQAACEG